MTAPVALVTGGSRGIGAAAAPALAARGYDVALTYRNKAARAGEVAARVERHGRRALAVGCDITRAEDVARLFTALREWSGRLDALILNASGGLERDLVAADPLYPLRINRDAQLALLDAALPLMPRGGVIVFITSHWSHLYGRVQQLPVYEPVASSKYAGETALRARQEELAARGVRLAVVTGDLIEDSITPKLLERVAPGVIEGRRMRAGGLPTSEDMGAAIARAATESALPSGETIVIGGALEPMLREASMHG